MRATIKSNDQAYTCVRHEVDSDRQHTRPNMRHPGCSEIRRLITANFLQLMVLRNLRTGLQTADMKGYAQQEHST